MKQVSKAIWYIESHIDKDLTLGDVASVSHLGEETLCRYFILATGKTVFGYIRSRRLHRSISLIMDESQPLVQVALSSGYSSQEAFSRAFRREFGFTPGALRSTPDLAKPLEKTAMRVEPDADVAFDPPRIEQMEEATIRGLEISCDHGGDPAIPGLWGKLNSIVEPGGNKESAFGVCHSFTESGMHYLAGYAADPDLPDALENEVTLPGGTYAVFASSRHVAEIAALWKHAFATGLAENGCCAASGPCFERYGRNFDPATGLGGFEIWIPVEG